MRSAEIELDKNIWSNPKGKYLNRKKVINIEDIFKKHARNLMGYIRTLTRDESHSEDVLQEVFFRLAKYQKNLGNVKNIRAYLFEMSRNESFRLMSKEKRIIENKNILQKKLLIEARQDAISQKEKVEELSHALEVLPDEQREVVFLKCLEGFTFEEIAELVGISKNTAASRYRYGLEKLKNIMGANKDEV